MTDDTTTDDTTEETSADRRRLVRTGGLAVGFAALAAAILVAHAAPARTYELSIYRATPTAFWVGVGIALFAALFVAFDADATGQRSIAVTLGGFAIFTVAALPIIRGYYFYGRGDALTHWGWTRFLAHGDISAFDLLYPGIHTIAAFTSEVTATSFPRAILLVVLLFALIYLLFVPLTAAAIDSRAAAIVAGFTALLFLPINDVSVFFMVHPSTQGIMFFPVILYLAIRFITGDTDEPLLRSSFGALLAITLIAFVLIHPQQAANVLLLLGTISLVQFGYRRFRRDHTISHHRPVYAHTAILAVAFLAWTPQHPVAQGAMNGLAERLQSGVFNTGAESAQRASSLAAIGGSIEELFAKLFLVAAIVSVLAAGLMLANLMGWLDNRKPDANAVVTYLTFGLVPLFVLFLAFFVTGYQTIHFRMIGFMMVIVSILGAIAVARGIGSLGDRFGTHTAWTIGAVGFALFLVASVPVMYASPYIYQNSQHVTERQVEGYATAFDHRADGIRFTGIRSPAIRFGDALLGYQYRSHYARPGSPTTPSFAGAELYGNMPDGAEFSATTVVGMFSESHYLPVTVTDRQREVRAYKGIRFSQRGFDSLSTHPRVNRIQSNGDFELFLIDES